MCTVILTMLLAGQAGQLPSSQVTDTEGRKSDAQQVERWHEYYRKEVEDYRMYLRDGDQRRLELQEKPVLKWTNPVQQSGVHGALYLWMLNGRPAVAGSISTSGTRERVWHQFHSLLTQPLVAERRGARLWYPKVAGIDPKEIPGAPQPAASAPLRLAQMRSLSRRFRAGGIDSSRTHRYYRLLAQPLHRYAPAPASAVLDGALFCFVMGTDPELLLLIEARTIDDQVKWCFSPGRFTDMALQLEFDQTMVWEEEFRRGTWYKADELYIKRYFRSEFAE